MKKHLLSLLIVWLTFIGFSNAVEISQTVNLDVWWRFSLTNPDFTYTVSCLNCTANKDIKISADWYMIKYCWDGCTISSSDWYPNGSFASPMVFQDFNFKWVSFVISYDDWTVAWWSGDNWWSDDWWNLVSGDDLSPVVSWLFSVVWEFIPYIVYISIWLLLSTLWFYAIKWLCNWFYNKFLSIFKK